MKVYFAGAAGFCLKRKIKKIFECAIDMSQLGFKNFSVSVAFVDEEQIKTLNKQFRSVDKVTDVLSFPSVEFVNQKIDAKVLSQEMNLDDGTVNLGDIAICLDVAKLQAKEYEHSFKREVCFLALHGLLHLIGYDHMNTEEESQMMSFAEKVLKQNHIGRKHV